MKGAILRLVTAILATVPIIGCPSLRAYADDTSAIAAVVTAAQTVQGMSTPGVFRQFVLIENLPYAHVSAENGVIGNGSMSYLLSKTSGSWKILGRGGGVLGASEMIAFGVPSAKAEKLEGVSCKGQPLDSESHPYLARTPYRFVSGNIRATRSQVNPQLYELASNRGPAVLPRKSTVVSYGGRRMVVDVIAPLESYACVIGE